MEVVESSTEAATVTLTAFEVLVILQAVTSLEDLSQLRLPFLDEKRQPEVDALYGDLSGLLEAMGGNT